MSAWNPRVKLKIVKVRPGRGAALRRSAADAAIDRELVVDIDGQRQVDRDALAGGRARRSERGQVSQRCKQRRRAESDRQRAGRQRRVDSSHIEVEVRQGWFGCVFLIIVFVCKGGAAKAERHQQGKRDDSSRVRRSRLKAVRRGGSLEVRAQSTMPLNDQQTICRRRLQGVRATQASILRLVWRVRASGQFDLGQSILMLAA